MARGLGRGFTPAHIHSQLGSYTDQIAQSSGSDRAKEWVRGVKLRDCCKVIKAVPHQTQL